MYVQLQSLHCAILVRQCTIRVAGSRCSVGLDIRVHRAGTVYRLARQHSRHHYESVLAGAYRRVTDGDASGTDAGVSGKRLGLGTGSQSVSQTLLDGNADQYLQSVRPGHHVELS